MQGTPNFWTSWNLQWDNFTKPYDYVLKLNNIIHTQRCVHQIYEHRRMGPVSFRGAEVNCPNIFSIACPKIKWFCPNITCFLPENGHLKIQGGGGGRGLAPPPQASYAYVYETQKGSILTERFNKYTISTCFNHSDAIRHYLLPATADKVLKTQVLKYLDINVNI